MRVWIPINSGGNDQGLLCEFPRGFKNIRSFLHIFNDIDDIPEIHDVGGTQSSLWLVRRVPANASHA